VVASSSGEAGNPGTLGMTKGRATLPLKVVQSTHQTLIGSAVLCLVIPSGAEGSAVFFDRDRKHSTVKPLFTLNSTQKQFYKSIAIGSQAHSHIRLQHGDTFDFIVISVQNIVLV
jgi:hypothetical protein